jgi:hypothetical protein
MNLIADAVQAACAALSIRSLPGTMPDTFTTRAKRAVRAFPLAVALTAGSLGMVWPAHDVQAALVSAVQYSYSPQPGFVTFFLTAFPDEIDILDSGHFAGWTRGWTEFKVNDSPGPGLVPVCRFYSAAFAPKVSHFYTAFADECAGLKANPDWIYEGDVFYVELPDANGGCPAGQMPIYRTYNGGLGGAPAHLFTPYQQDGSIAYGPMGVPEGPNGVAFCAPVSLDLAQQRTQQMSAGTWQFSYENGGAAETWTLRFGNAVLDYAPQLPPQFEPELPYTAPNVGGTFPRGATAGWDPIASKIDVILARASEGSPGIILQFDFDGVNATSGCAFFVETLVDPRGACHPLTILRM